jgi:hypothetical protein
MSNSDLEKTNATFESDHLEKTYTAQLNDERINRFTPEEQKKIIWRIDRDW